MFNVTKSFFPVGQGGFYSERIIYNGMEKVFVYDCGSVVKNTKRGPTQELVDCIHKSGMAKVDYVVISHLDKDHINGIPELEDYLIRDVGLTPSELPLIIIPHPTPIDKILFFGCGTQNTINWFFNVVQEKRMVYLVNADTVFKEPLLLNQELAGRVISHHAQFSIFQSNKIWQFKFYVDKGNYRNRLTQSDSDLIQKVKSFDDFVKNKDKLKSVYKKIRYGMNGSAMSMVSFPIFAKECSRDLSFVTWLNGDMRLKTRREKLSIEKHFTCLDGKNVDFQIPHHGSHENLGSLPKNVNNLRTYVWAGLNNGYRHPSPEIVNMAKSNSLYSRITENSQDLIVRHETWF